MEANDEIEAARQRLFAARTRIASAAIGLESAEMEMKASEKELSAATKQMKKMEEKWHSTLEDDDDDADDDDVSDVGVEGAVMKSGYRVGMPSRVNVERCGISEVNGMYTLSNDERYHKRGFYKGIFVDFIIRREKAVAGDNNWPVVKSNKWILGTAGSGGVCLFKSRGGHGSLGSHSSYDGGSVDTSSVDGRPPRRGWKVVEGGPKGSEPPRLEFVFDLGAMVSPRRRLEP